MTKIIQCKYSCRGCSLDKVTVSVRGRTIEPIKVWLDDVLLPCIAIDHARRSPGCTSAACDLMIPLFEDADTIGEAGTIPASEESLAELRKSL